MLQALDLDEKRNFFLGIRDAGGIDRWMQEYVERPYESEDPDIEYGLQILREELEQLEIVLHATPRAALLGSIIAANRVPTRSWETQMVDEPEELMPPRWPTGCSSIDKTIGGGYGFACFSGAPKVGKSMLAISSAVSAAIAGWRVVYANCELDRGDMTRRIRNYMTELHPGVIEQMRILHGGQGLTIDSLIRELDEIVKSEDSRLLIVLDSINRAVDFETAADERANYWGAHARWQHFMMQSRRNTAGRVSWLVLSELNRDGVSKGRSIEHVADLVVALTPSSAQNVVNIDIRASRSTESGDQGLHFRDFSTGRFERMEEFAKVPTGLGLAE